MQAKRLNFMSFKLNITKKLAYKNWHMFMFQYLNEVYPILNEDKKE